MDVRFRREFRVEASAAQRAADDIQRFASIASAHPSGGLEGGGARADGSVGPGEQGRSDRGWRARERAVTRYHAGVLSRHLSWDGCFNTRDLGDLATANGGRTRRRAAVRSDAVDRL